MIPTSVRTTRPEMLENDSNDDMSKQKIKRFDRSIGHERMTILLTVKQEPDKC